jgi:uncharacterized membrane protein YvbJ
MPRRRKIPSIQSGIEDIAHAVARKTLAKLILLAVSLALCFVCLLIVNAFVGNLADKPAPTIQHFNELVFGMSRDQVWKLLGPSRDDSTFTSTNSCERWKMNDGREIKVYYFHGVEDTYEVAETQIR